LSSNPAPRRLRVIEMAPLFTAKRWVSVLAAASATACASTQYGATDTALDQAHRVAHRGASLFQRECAGCHGERGEGASAPRIMGQTALPEYPRERSVNTTPAAGDPEHLRLESQSRPMGAPRRDPFRTARDLHYFVSTEMPPSKQRREALTDEDYWDIVNFMLVAHGVPVPPEGVTESNASSVELPGR
jgi:cytochrome c